MELEYGTEVVDRNGRVLGTIGYVIRNTWTGSISKFSVRREASQEALFFSPQDVLELTDAGVKVNFPFDELKENA